MGFLKNKNVRVIILVMLTLVIISTVVSQKYYRKINQSNDPRVVKALELYKDYNRYVQKNNFLQVLSLLDSIENIYTALPHYAHSFEPGVLDNNRSAVYLTLAIHKDSIQLFHENQIFKTFTKDSLLNLAFNAVGKSITCYMNWLNTFQDLSEIEIRNTIEFEFLEGLEKYADEDQGKYLEKRIKDLIAAQSETKRRLSVSYTNLGIIYRHKKNYKQAITYYERAIELWDQNLSAENNLKKLLGKPEKKRSFIQKLFPPKKN